MDSIETERERERDGERESEKSGHNLGEDLWYGITISKDLGPNIISFFAANTVQRLISKPRDMKETESTEPNKKDSSRIIISSKNQ